MGWENLTAKQFVSFNDAKGSPFNVKIALPTSDRFMCKSKLIEHLNVAPVNMSGYADNQWVPKEALAEGRATTWRGIDPYCIQSDRPGGLPTYNFKYGVDFGGIYYNTTATHESAYDCGWKWYCGGTPRGTDCQMATLAVGQTVYLGTGTDTNVLTDGYYILDYPVSGVVVYQVVSGVLTEISPYYF